MSLSKRRKIRYPMSDLLFHGFNYTLCVLIIIITFYPFYYMVMLSISGGDTYAKILLWPINLSFRAYSSLYSVANVGRGAFVSVARSVIGPFCTIFFTFMGAYVTSRQDLIFRKFFVRFITFSMYFTAGMIPVYINITSLKLSGSFWVYIIPGMVGAYSLILIRAYISELPISLQESAFIDGANDLYIAWRIIFPLSMPVIAAIILFSFIGQWNAYMDTLLYNTHKTDLYTLQYILRNYMNARLVQDAQTSINRQMEAANSGVRFSPEAIRMSLTVMVCIPILIVYPFLQRYFIKGLLVGAIKG